MKIRNFGWRFVLIFFISINSAFAASGDWLLCSKCATPAQFEAAAISYTGIFTGYFEYYVANPSSGEIRYINLLSSKSGTVPLRTVPLATQSSSGIEAAAGGGDIVPAVLSGKNTYQILLDTRQSAETEIQFMDIVAAAKVPLSSGGEVIDHGRPGVLPNDPGYSSFSGRNKEELSDWLWEHGGKSLYEQRHNSIVSSYLSDILDTVELDIGTPATCVIFNNGDIACFSYPLSENQMSTYMPGTARDSSNSPIGDSGGEGGPYTVRPGIGGSGYGPVDYTADGSLWLFCTFIGGKISSCEIRWVPD